MPQDPGQDPNRKRLGAVLGGLAHEIKNPLSTINLNLELLREDWAAEKTPLGKRSVEKVDVLLQETRRLQRMLEDFQKLVAHADLDAVPRDLNAVIEDVVDFMAVECRKRGIVTTEQLDSSLPPIPFDENLIRQALINLIKNAIEAMEERGGTLTVQTRRESSGVAIEVIDSGAGMNEKTRARIFDAYFSTKPDGAGLGLAMVRKIVERHGGALDAQSAPGRGTLMTMRLPFAPPVEAS